MGNFKRNTGFGRSGGKWGFGGRNSRQSGLDQPGGQMFSATCSSCHQACEVPFRPSGDRPVFCNDCFRNSRGESSLREFGVRNGNKDHSSNRSFTPAVRAQPTFSSDKKVEDIKKQLELVNNKLDTLTKMVGALGVANELKKVNTEEKEVKAKKIVKAKVPIKTPAKKKTKVSVKK